MSRRRVQATVQPAVRPVPKARAQPAAQVSMSWTYHVLPMATVAVLAAALYAPSLNGPFVYDDPNAISQSMLVRRLLPLTRFVTLSTRPLTDFSYALNYAMGGLDTWPYHLTNIVLHLINGLLIYAIAWATFAFSGLARRYGAAAQPLAWAAAALFVVHPLASESVAYVSSRSEVLAAFWILLALGSYLVAVHSPSTRWRRAAAALIVIATAAGVGSKEIAAAIPFLLLLYDWLFLAEGSWRRMRPRRWLIGLSLIPLVAGGAFLVVRAYVSPSPMGNYGATAGFGFDRFTRWEYLLTQFGVIVCYLRLVVVPMGQTFDYDWPLARTPVAPGVLVPFMLLAGLVYLAVRLRRTQPLFTFAVAWTLLILAPTSSVLPIADLAVERRMYLPLAGLMLLAAAWLWDLVQLVPPAWRQRPQWTYVALVVIPLAVFSVLTYRRATLWGDIIALHEDGVAKTPDNPRVRLNLGVGYLNSGQPQRARDTLATAKALYDKGESVNAFPRIGAFIHYNLGAVLFARKEVDEAERELVKSIELGGQYLALRPMAYMLLARIAAQRGDWKAASTYQAEAVKYKDDPDWRVDLAQMQRQAGDVTGARATLQRVLRAQPGNKRATATLADIDQQRPSKPLPAP
jgi:tetratricopeptide (TPR) repeat protein